MSRTRNKTKSHLIQEGVTNLSMIVSERSRNEHNSWYAKLDDLMLLYPLVENRPFAQGLKNVWGRRCDPHLAAWLGAIRHHWIVSAGRSLGCFLGLV